MGIILIGNDKTCFCDCATKCPLGKTGSSPRCRESDLHDAGFTTIQIATPKSQKKFNVLNQFRDAKRAKIQLFKPTRERIND